MNRFIRLVELKEKVGLGRSSIYFLMDKGLFPRQYNIGPRSVAWLESDIDNWIQQKIKERDKKSS